MMVINNKNISKSFEEKGQRFPAFLKKSFSRDVTSKTFLSGIAGLNLYKEYG
jgi:hypothetical protein